MSIFDGLKKNYEKDGVCRPEPEGGAARWLFLVKNNFWTLVSANLLFVAFSLPLITLPAALCALDRVCIKLVIDGRCFLFQDFWKEFKESFLKSLLMGLFCGAGYFASYYLLSLGLSNAESIFGIVFSAIGLCVLLYFIVRASWSFVLLAMLDLSFGDIMKNSAAMMALEWKSDLLMIVSALIFALVSVMLFPFSILPLLLLLFSLLHFTLCYIINEPVQSRIVRPYEEKKSKEE